MDQQLVPLSTFCTFTKGLSYKGAHLDEDGPFLVGIGTISEGGGFKSQKLRTYSGPHKSEQRISPGEIYVAMTNMAEETSRFLGSTARFPEVGQEYGILTHHVSKVSWKTGDLLMQEFLYWVMRSHAFHRHCRNYGTGTTVYAVKGKDAERFLVPTSLTPELRTWTHLLSTFDSQEQSILLQQTQLESMLQAIFKAWFVDFSPMKIEQLDPHESDDDLANLYPQQLVETPDGWIPEGWETTNLMDIEFTKGRVPRESESAPMIPLLNMDYFKTGTPTHVPDERATKVSKGDVVMLMDGENSGFTARSPLDAAIGSTFAHLRHKDFSNHFLLHVLMINEYWVRRNTTGTGIPHVDKEIVRRLSFPRPPASLLKRFDGTARAIYAQIETLENQLVSIRRKKEDLAARYDVEMFNTPCTTLNPP